LQGSKVILPTAKLFKESKIDRRRLSQGSSSRLAV
jgi:hypothetical protein